MIQLRAVSAANKQKNKELASTITWLVIFPIADPQQEQVLLSLLRVISPSRRELVSAALAWRHQHLQAESLPEFAPCRSARLSAMNTFIRMRAASGQS